jgi:hypothetical protein
LTGGPVPEAAGDASGRARNLARIVLRDFECPMDVVENVLRLADGSRMPFMSLFVPVPTGTATVRVINDWISAEGAGAKG